ncbi:MAG: beta-lactamase family protein [Acidimicrobiia bacterium]|nr:beta-lactamase family protein [Acidimicrobiia bacterium]
MDHLANVSEWPVERVGAAAVLPDGSVLRVGATTDRFALASVTKVLVAVAVMVAVEEETLRLDEPAGPPGATVGHLLAHASGLAADSDQVIGPPGTRRIYSNRGFEVLGAILTDRAGMDVSAYLHAAVFEPLGMEDTTLEGSPAHGAVGTVDDLIRLVEDLRSPQPTVVAASSRDLLASVAYPGLPGVLPGFGQHADNTWGLGVEIRGAKSPHWTPDGASPRTFGHFGRSGSLVWIDPDHGAALVVLGDRDFGDWAPARWRALGDEVLRAAAAVTDDLADVAPDRQHRGMAADVEGVVDESRKSP